ncbi:MAG: radical SAM protein [Bacillota bacterium]
MKDTSNKINLTVLITSKCTLKCKLCATYSPIHPSSCHYLYERITTSVERFFNSTGDVKLFTISGGEPLLHPQLPELIDFFASNIERIGMFEIITNGTVIPNEKLLQRLGFSDKVNIMVDDYGPNLSTKVSQIVDAFNKHGIKYRVRKYYGEDAHCGGWLDISDFSDKQRTEKENEELFARCMYTTTFRNHIFIINGTAHMCYINKQLLDFIPDNPSEYVDLMDDSLSAPDIKTQLIGLRNRKRLSVCSYCNGFCVDAKRYKPAEQI